MSYTINKNSSKLILNLKEGSPIRINLDDYTADKAYDLFDKVAVIRIKNSPHAKFPREERESDDEWRERVKQESEKDQIRKKGEELEVYLRRIFDAKHEMHQQSYEILNAICEVFGLEQLTPERFKSANWMSTKKFIYDVLNLGDIPCADYLVEETTK